MQLLKLEEDQVSLELHADELAGVIASLRGLGGFRRQRRASYDLVRAGGSELILTSDWDEPCLVSKDAAGTRILRDIFDLSSAAQGDRASAYRAASPG